MRPEDRRLLDSRKIKTTVETIGKIQVPTPKKDAKQLAHEAKSYEERIRHGRDVIARDLYEESLKNGKPITKDHAYRLAMEAVERVTKGVK